MSGSIQDLGRLQVWTVMRLTQPPSGLVPGLLLPVISATRPGTVFSTGPSRQTNITVADRRALPGPCRTTQRLGRLAEGADEGAAHPHRIAKAGGLHAHDPGYLPSRAGRTGGYRCPRLLRVKGPARLLLCVNAMSGIGTFETC
jgi:hypothetical protein